MELDAGTVLAGRFEVDGTPLGAGASGVVYPAVDRHSGRAVAAKVLHPALSSDPDALGRLQLEASTAGRLKHPHVLEVLGLHSDRAGRWVLVTERVDGLALSGLEGPLSAETVVALGLQVCEALVAAHATGIVHGDVRPGNVLISGRGALLFDFGVANLSGGDAMRAGQTAPEVLAGGTPGVPADLYGLGIVLHQALFATPVWREATPWAIMGAQRAGVPELDGPRGLVRLVRRLLEPDPADRPSSARRVHRVLEKLKRDPDRRVAIRGPFVPPVRPGRAWLVHGVDPGTGGPALVRTGLPRGAALALVTRLRAQGWDVRAEREALGLSDTLWVVILGLLGGIVVPVVGLVPALVLAMRWRGRKVRPELRRALPPVSVPVPPRELAAGTETAVAAGLLLLATAVALWGYPALAVLPAMALLALGWFSWRTERHNPAELARSGRVRTAFVDLRAELDSRLLPLEDALGLAGEVDALEAGWLEGEVDEDELLVGLDGLSARVLRAPAADGGQATTLDALRRVQDP